MPTVYPGALDDLDADLIPGSGANADVPLGEDGAGAFIHPEHHATLAGAVEGLEAKLGTGTSTPIAGAILLGSDPGESAWVADAAARAVLLTGAAGGAAAGGESVTITGGTGDSGNDAGASLTVSGGDGAGTPGTVTATSGMGATLLVGETVEFTASGGTGFGGGSSFQGNAGADGYGGGLSFLAGAGDTGLPGGDVVLAAGKGDHNNDLSATMTLTGGDGAGTAGVVSVRSAGVTFTLKQAAWVDPSTGTAADIIAALIAAGLMAAS